MPLTRWSAARAAVRGRPIVASVLVAVVALVAGAVAGALLAGGSGMRASEQAGTPVANRPATLPPGVSLVANARRRSVAVYGSPGAHTPTLQLSNPNDDGAPLTFLVKSVGEGWDHVYLPSRPNGSTGWVRASDVKVSADQYRLRVNLKTHRMVALRGTNVIMREPVGVGQAASPTPPGLYFITELLKQPDPYGIYGPYAFGLSVHTEIAEIRKEFPGSDGRIGLHGTNNPAGLGTDVSHGCIRLSNASISRLAHLLPAGTPVRIRG